MFEKYRLLMENSLDFIHCYGFKPKSRIIYIDLAATKFKIYILIRALW